MKNRSLFLTFLSVIILCTGLYSCSENNSYIDKELAILDAEIEKHPEYEKKQILFCDSLKIKFQQAESDSAKYFYASKIQEQYFSSNLDSLLKYTGVMERYMGQDTDKQSMVYSYYALYYIKLRELDTAQEYMDKAPYPTDGSKEAIRNYYRTICWLYAFDKSKDSIRTELIKEFWQRDSSSSQAWQLKSSIARRNKDLNSALLYAMKGLDCATSYYDYATGYFILSNVYKTMGDPDKREYYLIQSAIADLYDNAKQYESFYRLAKLRYEKGDYDHALKYMQLTLDDAIETSYGHRLAKANSAVQMYYASYLQMGRKRQLTTYAMIAVLIFVLAIISSFLIYTHKINKSLSTSRKALAERIKIQNHFLGTYLEQASNYMGEVDKMRSKIRKSLRNGGLDNMLALLREPSFSDEEIKNFYSQFDDTFNDIFPDFAKEAEKLTNNFGSAEHTKRKEIDLRILALIRLDITETSKISNILNISTWTVYTYLHRMRKSANLSPNEFIAAVQDLCSGE